MLLADCFLSVSVLRCPVLLCCMCLPPDDNQNGLLELDEFTRLVTDVLNRMQAQLPSELPRKYCVQFDLDLGVLDGIEGRIGEKMRGLSRAAIAKQLFDLMDEEHHRGYLDATQMTSLHRLMEQHVLKDLYESIGQMMVQKQMAQYDGV